MNECNAGGDCWRLIQAGSYFGSYFALLWLTSDLRARIACIVAALTNGWTDRTLAVCRPSRPSPHLIARQPSKPAPWQAQHCSRRPTPSTPAWRGRPRRPSMASSGSCFVRWRRRATNASRSATERRAPPDPTSSWSTVPGAARSSTSRPTDCCSR